jgi:hypothetical protein
MITMVGLVGDMVGDGLVVVFSRLVFVVGFVYDREVAMHCLYSVSLATTCARIDNDKGACAITGSLTALRQTWAMRGFSALG